MAAQEDPENKVDLRDISLWFCVCVWCLAHVTVRDRPIYCADIYHSKTVEYRWSLKVNISCRIMDYKLVLRHPSTDIVRFYN